MRHQNWKMTRASSTINLLLHSFTSFYFIFDKFYIIPSCVKLQRMSFSFTEITTVLFTLFLLDLFFFLVMHDVMGRFVRFSN